MRSRFVVLAVWAQVASAADSPAKPVSSHDATVSSFIECMARQVANAVGTAPVRIDFGQTCPGFRSLLEAPAQLTPMADDLSWMSGDVEGFFSGVSRKWLLALAHLSDDNTMAALNPVVTAIIKIVVVMIEGGVQEEKRRALRVALMAATNDSTVGFSDPLALAQFAMLPDSDVENANLPAHLQELSKLRFKQTFVTYTIGLAFMPNGVKCLQDGGECCLDDKDFLPLLHKALNSLALGQLCKPFDLFKALPALSFTFIPLAISISFLERLTRSWSTLPQPDINDKVYHAALVLGLVAADNLFEAFMELPMVRNASVTVFNPSMSLHLYLATLPLNRRNRIVSALFSRVDLSRFFEDGTVQPAPLSCWSALSGDATSFQMAFQAGEDFVSPLPLHIMHPTVSEPYDMLWGPLRLLDIANDGGVQFKRSEQMCSYQLYRPEHHLHMVGQLIQDMPLLAGQWLFVLEKRALSQKYKLFAKWTPLMQKMIQEDSQMPLPASASDYARFFWATCPVLAVVAHG